MRKLSFVLLPFFFLLCHSNSFGQWQFANRAGGSLGDIGKSVAVGAHGALYVGGTFNSASVTFGSTTLVNDSAGTSDIFLVKYDSLGNVMWARREGGKGDDMLNAIAADSNGAILITGNFSGPSLTLGATTFYNHACTRFFIARYSGTGAFNWARSYDTAYNTIGCGETYSSSLVTGQDGSAFLSTYFVGTMVLGHDTLQTSLYDRYESLVMKYDSTGNLHWEKKIYSEPYTFVVISSIALDATGNIYATGFTNGDNLYAPPISSTGGAYTWKHFLLKLDTAGNGTHISKIYSDACCDFIHYSVAVGSLNDIYLAGYFGSHTVPDFVIGTQTLHNYSPGTTDAFLAKYDSTCSFVWARQAGSDADDYVTAISVARPGTVYVAGSFKGSVAAFGTKTLPNQGASSLFFAAYDAAGNALYAKAADGANNTICSSIVAVPGNAVYIAGSFYSDSLNFGTAHLTNAGSPTDDFFVAKYKETGIEEVPAISINPQASVYPNPVAAPGYLNVKLPARASCRSMELFNALGKSVGVFPEVSNTDKPQLILPVLPAGFYYLRVYCTTGSLVVPVVLGE